MLSPRLSSLSHVHSPLLSPSRNLVLRKHTTRFDFLHQMPNPAKFSQHDPILKAAVPVKSTAPTPQPTLPPRQPSVNETSNPGISIFHLIREAKTPVRYTVYGALSILATVECTFWIKVIQHKFFAKSDQEKEGSERFFRHIGERLKRYRVFWLRAYGRYYGETVWGV